MTNRASPPTYRILSPVQNLLETGDGDSLETINTFPLPNGSVCWVVASNASFRLFKNSTTAPDNITILAPSAGPGRWFIETNTGAGGFQYQDQAGTLYNSRAISSSSGAHPVDTGTAIELRDGDIDVLGFASLSAAAAATSAVNGQTLLCINNTYAIDVSITDTTLTLKTKAGAVLTAAANRTLDCGIDFSEGGVIRPANGVTVTITGPVLVPDTHFAFDTTSGGSFLFEAGAVGHLTPFNFGAKGDGVTDDTAAIQAAIDTAANVHQVYFPLGVYLCTNDLLLPTGTLISGEADNQDVAGTQIKLDGTGNSITLNAAELVKIRNIQINIGSAAAAGLKMIGACAFLRFEQLTFLSSNPAASAILVGAAGSTTHTALFVSIDHMIVYGAANQSVPLLAIYGANNAVNNWNVHDALLFTSAGGATAPQVLIYANDAGPIYNMAFRDCVFEVPTAGAIHAYSVQALTIDNAWIGDLGPNTHTDHIIKVAKSAAPGALSSYGTLINNMTCDSGVAGKETVFIDGAMPGTFGHVITGSRLQHVGDNGSGANPITLVNTLVVAGYSGDAPVGILSNGALEAGAQSVSGQTLKYNTTAGDMVAHLRGWSFNPASYAALYAGAYAATPTAINYSLLVSDANGTVLNGPNATSKVRLQINGSGSSGLYLDGTSGETRNVYPSKGDPVAGTPFGSDGYTSVLVQSGTATLPAADAACKVIEFVGLLTGNMTVIFPTVSGYTKQVLNSTTGAFTLTIKTLAGSGLVLAAGTTFIFCDGTNVRTS